MSLVAIREPATAEEALARVKAMRAKVFAPGTVKRAEKPVVVDVLARRKEIEDRRSLTRAANAELHRRERSGPAVNAVEDVARRHRVAASDIYGRSRHGRLREARQEAYEAVVQACPAWSLHQVADFFGGRDHSCIIKVLNRRKTRPVRPPDTRPEQVLADWNRGIRSKAALGRKYGVCESTVRYWLRKLGAVR